MICLNIMSCFYYALSVRSQGKVPHIVIHGIALAALFTFSPHTHSSPACLVSPNFVVSCLLLFLLINNQCWNQIIKMEILVNSIFYYNFSLFAGAVSTLDKAWPLIIHKLTRVKLDMRNISTYSDPSDKYRALFNVPMGHSEMILNVNSSQQNFVRDPKCKSDSKCQTQYARQYLRQCLTSVSYYSIMSN